jgi:hypothetical protein
MLGQEQRRQLQELLDSILKYDNVRVEFYAYDCRPYSREYGKGHAISYQAFECYEEGDYKFGYRVLIANVGSEHGIQPKIKELTGWLMERGCPREKIKAQRIRGKIF